MNPLMVLIADLERYLEEYKLAIIKDLEFFIKRESPNPNFRMFSFIYDNDDFRTVIYSLDNKGDTITDVVGLPIKNYDDLYAMENYGEFIPYALAEKENVIYSDYRKHEDKDKMKEYWKYSEEYYERKREIFENWFMQCWQAASKNTNTNIKTSFNVHDSSGGIDLATGIYMTDDEINSFFD